MGLSSRLLRLPRPQTFLYIMSLSTGASLITLSLLLNKLSGFYGILALLTGYHLSPFQLSMYIYSIAALILTIILSPHIKTQSPFHCLALAWFYVLDSIINAAYTAAFAMSWFLVLASHASGQNGTAKGPGSDTIGDTAGFTDPQLNVSRVEVVANPQTSSLLPGQDAVAGAVPADSPSGASSANASEFVLGRESINSIGVIIALWTIRMYFCLVMLAWARKVVRQHIAIASVRSGAPYSTSGSKKMADNPFAEEKPEGQGWKGKLGRFMVAIGRTYWLGSDDDESWAVQLGGRFRKGGNVAGQQSGEAVPLQKVDTRPTERERRRRSGTGPPLPEVQAAAVGKVPEEDEVGENNGLLKVPSQ